MKVPILGFPDAMLLARYLTTKYGKDIPSLDKLFSTLDTGEFIDLAILLHLDLEVPPKELMSSMISGLDKNKYIKLVEMYTELRVGL